MLTCAIDTDDRHLAHFVQDGDEIGVRGEVETWSNHSPVSKEWWKANQEVRDAPGNDGPTDGPYGFRGGIVLSPNNSHDHGSTDQPWGKLGNKKMAFAIQ